MGKVALLAIGAFVIMSAYYGMGTRTQLLAADEQIAQHDYQVVLRNAAMSGFNRAKQELVQSFTGTSFSGPFEDANYNTSVMANPVTKIADVTSTGWMYDPSGKLLQYQIIAKIRLLETTSTDTTVVLPAAPPKFMQYALITEENLTLNGNVDVEAVPIEIEGKESAAYNANIHTNGDMTVNGRVTVRGFGTYRGTNLINPNDPHRFFKPYDNSSGDDVLKRLTEDVEIPLASMNPDSLNAKFPPDVQTVGDTTLDGNLNFKAMASPGDGAGRGTREHPYILYVNGDLTLNGDVEMDGYGIILVKD
ncbi:MAG TPA: hypothetical protein VFG50_16005, partial [Rhodothermales bacterium]|nr:hypothetical protein [Rhodothermales bacterium]